MKYYKFDMSNLKKSRFSKLDKNVLSAVNGCSNIALCGGSLRTLLLPNDIIADYDIFILDKFDELDSDVETLDKIVKVFKAYGFNVTFRCPLNELVNMKNGDLKVQIIYKYKFKQTTKEILNRFDINLGRIGLHQGSIYVAPEAIKDSIKNRITINMPTYPSSTLQRIIKYSQKGFYIDHEARASFLFKIIELYNKDPKALLEQLGLYAID